jgi:hypothetical protein
MVYGAREDGLPASESWPTMRTWSNLEALLRFQGSPSLVLSFLPRLATSTGHCHLQIILVLAAFVLYAIAMLGMPGLSLA